MLRLLLSFAWLAQVFGICYLIILEWNVFQVDAMGHLAGAQSFDRVGFHGFNDQYFTGIIQDLFYPPLHDFLLGGLLYFGFDKLFSLRLFECGVIALFFYSLFRLSLSFKKTFTRFFFLILTCAWFYRGKDGLITFQGLGMVDLMVTGLVSQFLGGAFFFLFLSEVVRPQSKNSKKILWLCLTVLSHLIMGFCAVLVLIFHSFFLDWAQKKKSALILLISGGLLSFWALPFVLESSRLVSYTILNQSSRYFFWISFALLIYSFFSEKSFFSEQKYFKKNNSPEKTAQALLMLSVFLNLPIMMAQLFPHVAQVLPPFHYYRLAIVSANLFVFSGLMLLENAKARNSKWVMGALLIST